MLPHRLPARARAQCTDGLLAMADVAADADVATNADVALDADADVTAAASVDAEVNAGVDASAGVDLNCPYISANLNIGGHPTVSAADWAPTREWTRTWKQGFRRT